MIPLPPLTFLDRRDTHRLIPSHYNLPEGASVLTLIAGDEAQLADLFDLDGATNDRLLAETDRLPGIGVGELVFGVPHFRIVNAAFCHPHPLGGRFNGPERGCCGTRASNPRPRCGKSRSTRRCSCRRSASSWTT